MPGAPGSHELRFYHLLNILSPSERNRLFSELTANLNCSESEKALRQLEESAYGMGRTASLSQTWASLLAPHSSDREKV